MPSIKDEVHRVEGNPLCPNCGKMLSGASELELATPENNDQRPAGPIPGDVTICAYCLAPLKFDKDMVLQIITIPELVKGMPPNELGDLLRFLYAARQAQLQARKEDDTRH